MKHVVLVALPLLAVAVSGGTIFATGPTPPFSTLAQERGSDDALPEAVKQSPGAEHLGPFDSARRVGSYHGRTYYLMRGTDEHVCLVDHVAPDLVGAVCAPWRGDSLDTVVSHATIDREGNRVIAVLAPDGYERVRFTDAAGKVTTAAVVNNVAFLSTDEQGVLALTAIGREPLYQRIGRSPAI